jgi:ketosteroid isomerase-like protein
MSKTGGQQRNVNIFRGFQAYVDGDFNAMQEMFAEDAVIHVSGATDSPFTGDHRGREDMRKIFTLAKEHQEKERWDVDGYNANDDYAVILARVSGSREGRSVVFPVVQVYGLGSDGKCSEAWFLMGTEYHQLSKEYWESAATAV